MVVHSVEDADDMPHIYVLSKNEREHPQEHGADGQQETNVEIEHILH